MLEKRFCPLEYRADAGRVEGTAVRYGSTANIAGVFKERFSPGAFGNVAGLDVIVRLQHERSEGPSAAHKAEGWSFPTAPRNWPRH